MLLWKEKISFENKCRVIIHRFHYGARQDRQNMSRTSRNRLKAAFLTCHQPSVKNLSSTHCCQLFRVHWGSLVWFPVCFIGPGLRAVHALCPLPIDHSPLLLTDSPTKKKQLKEVWSQPPPIDSIAADVLVPSVLDMTLHSVKLFSKHAARFEV